MKKRLLLGLTLALSVIPSVNIPTRQIEESKVEKIVEDIRIINQDTKKLRELQESYKRHENDERNYVTDDFTKDKDEVLLARMIMGEVAKHAKWEKMEIGSTAITRMGWGLTLKEVILFPRAYSCFNEDSNRLDELKHPFEYGKTEFLNCLEVSKELLEMNYKSLGATHYYNPEVVKKPQWANKMKFVGKVGPHLMYK